MFRRIDESQVGEDDTANTSPYETGTRETDALLDRLASIEAKLSLLLGRQPQKEWYTTTEAANLLGKRPFTCREWARHGRIRAEKRACGRGATSEWVISHDELERIRNHGLLPLSEVYRYGGRS